MRQLAAVVKDGIVTYYVVDAEEGELAEFAKIAVPDRFDVEAAVKIGFNLIAAVGLNGHRGPASRHIITPQQARPAALPTAGLEWEGTMTAIAYVRAHPGCTIPDIVAHYGASAKAVASAVTRGAQHGDIDRRHGKLFAAGGAGPAKAPRRPVAPRAARGQKWAVTREQVLDYIRAHPGCTVKDIATELLGGCDKDQRQVIGNRLAYSIRPGSSDGVVKSIDGAGRVTYQIEGEADGGAGAAT